MRERIYILITLVCSLSLSTHAQTPYDSFAPETSRPMLGLEDLRAIETSMPSKTQTDTMLCAVVIDMQAQKLLLVDVVCGDVIALAPLTDDMSKWLSVDPMSDKYPGISPYAYCGWNPIKFVDADGMDWYSVSHDPDDCHATVWEELIYNEI